MRIHSIFIALLLFSVFSEYESHTVITSVLFLNFLLFILVFWPPVCAQGELEPPMLSNPTFAK